MTDLKILLLLLFFSINQFSQAQKVLFNRGVNLTDWFQTPNPRQIQFSKFTKQDFINIKSLGCDVIRLPLNFIFMTEGEPDYTFDPLFLSFLDSAVNWAEEVEINLLLDNHSFDLTLVNNSTYESALISMWTQIAQRYKDRSEYIFYEIQNEPHDISDALWGTIQGNVIETLRGIDANRTIIVGAANWNSYNNLKYLPNYDDDNLIYTFHFYDPFLFTHQGADWTDPSMSPVTDIPFPYDADSMPESPSELNGTWVETLYDNYSTDGSGEMIRQWLDIAIDFRDNRNVPVFCGELGVYNLNSAHGDRIAWYDTVRNYLDYNDIAWTIWDYTGGFGLFEIGGNDLFDYDLDTALLRSLGFIVPPQQEFTIQPDTTGFPVYTDFIGNQIVESCYANEGTIDFYNTNYPNNNQYCIYWTGGGQYATVGFDFKPNKDLQTLTENDFAVDMLIRSNSPGARLDIRFIDTKTVIPEDHPWRMRYTIDETKSTWDGAWHHVHIPLSEFTEHGSWDGTWYNPIGEYDWSAVDRFEIVAEYQSCEGIHFWFDNIYITNMDTARVWDDTVITYLKKIDDNKLPEINAFPNPFVSSTLINYYVDLTGYVQIEISDVNGRLVCELENKLHYPGSYNTIWDGTDSRGRKVKKGVYFCRYGSADGNQIIKLLVF
jgi:endoglucanase